jgi:uncharacterized membrane protein YfcA
LLTQEFFGYLFSIFIGIILGLLGGGGSILTIPILVYLFHVDAVMASAYSLFVVGFTSLVGAFKKYKENRVNLRTGFLFGIPSLVSIFITRKWIIPIIPEVLWQQDSFILTKRVLLLGIFAALMVLASISMMRGGMKEFNRNDHRVKIFLVAVEGTLIGFLTGLVGAGGGFLIIPALVLLTGLPFKTAVGTSLFIIGINSLTGFLGDLLNYQMNWLLLFGVTFLAVVGIMIGDQFSEQISQKTLRKAFGWFVLLMGCFILTKEIYFS